MKTKNILLGLVAGVAVGTIIGILLAPDKGSKTRAKILEAGEDLSGKVKSKFGEMSNAISGKYHETLKEAENLIEKGLEYLPNNDNSGTAMNRDNMKKNQSA